MKTRIEIRGVIASARLDDPWFKNFIDKGMITPESRIRQAIAEAGPEIELYINSYGGDVLAGNEIIVSLKTAIAAGKKVEIVVGAMAFSMAANMIVMLPGAAKISAFSNTRIGFHGAYTYTEGGAGAHKDSAEMLAGINAQVIAAIKAKGYAGKVEEWFSEGRVKFLTADQALKMGIIDAIVDQADSPIVALEKDVAEKLIADGVNVAAFGDDNMEPIALEEPVTADMMSEFLARFNAMLKRSGAPEQKLVNVDAEAELPERLSKLQAAKDREIAALKADHDAAFKALTEQHAAALNDLTSKHDLAAKELGEAKASLSAVTEEFEKTKAALASTGKQLEEVKTAHAKLTGNALSLNDQIASWEQALAQLGYAAARKQYPDLYEAWMKERQAK